MVTIARSRDESTLLYILHRALRRSRSVSRRHRIHVETLILVKNIKEQALWDSDDLHANSLGLVSDSALARTAAGPRLW